MAKQSLYMTQRVRLRGVGFRSHSSIAREGWRYFKQEKIDRRSYIFEADVYYKGNVRISAFIDHQGLGFGYPIDLQIPSAEKVRESLHELRDETKKGLENLFPKSDISVNTDAEDWVGVQKISVSNRNPADEIYNTLKAYIKAKGKVN